MQFIETTCTCHLEINDSDQYCKRGYIDEFKIWRFFSKRQLASFNFDEFLNKSKSYLSLISYNARVRVIFLANSVLIKVNFDWKKVCTDLME